MSATRTSDVGQELHIPIAVRYLDLVALALALPLFLLAGFPIAGYLVGGGAWAIQRVVQVALTKSAAATTDPRTLVGITAASMIGRGWFCALAIFGVGLYQNEAGLAAALLVISLFTIYFTVQMIVRPMQKPLPKGTTREAAR
ncbi:MAG: hypothetical protein WDZ37_06125 [Solirubrobacterales bacterium]